MTVKAIAITKWRKNSENANVPDGIDTILNSAPGNSAMDITGQIVEKINAKVTGNVRNLVIWELWLQDATWTAYQNTNLVKWLLWTQTDEMGMVTGGNGNTTLTQQEWNTLTSFLTQNEFDISALAQTDTRQVLMDKLIGIIQVQRASE
jgi:hypothetical protein